MVRRFLAPMALLLFVVTISADEPQSVEQLEKQLAELQAKLEVLKRQQAAGEGKKVLSIAEADTWRNFRGSSQFDVGYRISNNGKWIAYRVGASEGEAEVVVRNLIDGKETKYPSGGGFSTFNFSFDSKWLSFSVTPVTPRGISPAVAAAMPRPKSKIVLLNLEKGEKLELEGFSSLQFSGEASTHVALRKSSESPAGSAPTNLPPGVTLPPGAASQTAAPTSSGSDLVIHELATGAQLVMGNVSEYSFNKKGDLLIMLIDAAGQIGNGVQVRDMKTGVVTPLETAKASYRSLNWHEDFTALTVIKAVEDKDYDGKWNTILAFTGLGSKPVSHTYDPKTDPNFPKDMGISSNRAVNWTKGLDAFTFGIAEQKKKDTSKKEAAPPPAPSAPSTPPVPSTGGPGRRRDGPGGLPTAGTSAGQPDLVIWHWKDSRLQPMQQVQANSDKSFTYLCIYHIKDKKFVQLANEDVRNVSLPGKQKFAIGQDVKPYEYMANLDGRRYSDIYVIDPKTGGRQKALTKVRFYFGPSADGSKLLYHDDGHFYAFDIASGKSINLTAKISTTSFVDTEDDHNIAKPPTNVLGWSKDSQFVLLSDGWDLWKVAADGSGGVNLTVNGKSDGIRYKQFSQFEPERNEPGLDFTKSAITSFYGEWTKNEGFGRIEPGRSGVTVLFSGAMKLSTLTKARDAERYVFTKQTAIEPGNLHVTDDKFQDVEKISDINPQQKDYHWLAGAKLIEYQALGKKLQGALFLPANYKPGTKYPTVVYIYEKLSDGLHSYTPPSTGGFNKSIYASHGYAVLMPDITYKVNDPGKSSVECINAALDAAIATGIVDGEKLGLQGHSWGGYQTAYAITQTNRFKAACAGAPLTDLVSMYSSVYWNSGSANQPIFESSQGRFTAGYWDQQEAYIRNSPVYFAKNVTTPLLLLHNDKDGAVDFTQGIEYYNTLRRLQKPVVMLQYKGENHGLVKPENRKDYAKRMQEFFDHYLMNKPAPDWWKDGVPHLKMDEYLKGRK